MAKLLTIEKVGYRAWYYSWSGTAPYRVYYKGRLFETTDNAYITMEDSGAETESTNEPPVIEVLDANDTDTAENLLYPPCLAIQWRGTTTADYYIVEEYSGGEWVERFTANESGAGYYLVNTSPISDLSNSQWRVTAVDTYGNETTPVSYTRYIVRNPAAPQISITYDDVDGEIDIEAA